MSLGIVFKGPEGVVLAADSRVTLSRPMNIGGQQFILPSTFDHATKLLRIPEHKNVGAITFGLGAIGTTAPRTASSFIPEFEAEIGPEPLSVKEFAQKLSAFFMKQWTGLGMPPNPPINENVIFFVVGYDEKAGGERSIVGKVFEVSIPGAANPVECFADEQFGMRWGGQREMVDRIIRGYDDNLFGAAYDAIGVPAAQRNVAELNKTLSAKLQIQIPFQFLPLQDCVDLAIFLIRATIAMQGWHLGLRGVGGPVDAAIITRTDGFQPIQMKHIRGEGTPQ